MTDAVNEIKNTFKPSFHRPYLNVSELDWTSVQGLYNTGADISCMSKEVFCQLPPPPHPTKLEGEPAPKFKSAGGQPLPVQGRYEFRIRISTKFLEHQFYVIPDLNELLILGIDFIQRYQFLYCPKNRSFAWEGQHNWGQGHLKVSSAPTVPPLSVTFIKATVRSEGEALPEGILCIASMASSVHPLVTMERRLV
jgi:hypothetical protein